VLRCVYVCVYVCMYEVAMSPDAHDIVTDASSAEVCIYVRVYACMGS
jgi:hypothetical protein